jgi:ankyrin repeat protein
MICSRRKTKITWTFLEFLLDDGANPNIADVYSRTPLHSEPFDCDAAFQPFDILVKHGANVNARDMKGQTALHFLVGKYWPE